MSLMSTYVYISDEALHRKSRIPLRYLVRSWFEPVCDQDSVMEFGFELVFEIA